MSVRIGDVLHRESALFPLQRMFWASQPFKRLIS
jgi:hypothetical protein